MIANRAPSSDVDPFSEAFLTDPWPCHAQLRDAGPVVYLERYGVWSMGRYDEVAATLNDWKTFGSGAGAGMANFHREEPWRRPSIILEADPPLHTRTHKVLLRVLSPSALRDQADLRRRGRGNGVDLISSGALTHSARSLDFGFDID